MPLTATMRPALIAAAAASSAAPVSRMSSAPSAWKHSDGPQRAHATGSA